MSKDHQSIELILIGGLSIAGIICLLILESMSSPNATTVARDIIGFLTSIITGLFALITTRKDGTTNADTNK